MFDGLSAGLVMVGGLILLRAGLAWTGLGRALPGRRRLRVRETCPLGSRQRLHLVVVDGEELLIGATDGSLRLLRRLGPAADAEEPAASPAPRAPAVLRLRAWRRTLGLGALAGVALLLGAADAAAQTAAGAAAPAAPVAGEAPTLSLSLEGVTQPGRIASTLEIVALLTLLSVAPAILLMATSFTRIVIVLSLLRQAVGVHQLPPNQVLVGLSLFLTIFVMAPVGERIHADALVPYMEQQVDAGTALAAGTAPVREHLLRHTRERDLQLFLDLAGADAPSGPEEVGLSSLLPAYMISEMRTAFEIGFMVYLPFLIIDLVIASMLISMGMIVLPPIVISLPFKLMLFVLLDGWNLVISALVKGLL